MTHFQGNSQTIGKSPLIHLNQEVGSRKQVSSSLFTAAQVIIGIALIALSTHLALQAETYLEILNQSGLNEYHAFALLVCFSFIAGVLLIAQQVLKHDTQFDEFSTY
ncbi:hypothetical protein [Polynucleobacter sp. AP-Titi-500A-B4]|uniref:hypothetical protein n=1 Tax=Polynucleobacter sp. AP-Titi-500A-B4 TaxID=2576923 RepID=UPI001BFDBDCD|nr:hypothetical protein [Polynucleobacter sp. AP-Titi-500A-B4]QWE13007.1 hypothetical protein FD968_02735 [Polynucleobacter sp. AP-Titi-500A-B4]